MNLKTKMKNSASVHVHDVGWRIDENVDGLYVHKAQQITDEYLDGLKDARIASTSAPAGEYHRIASIPVALVEKWLNEGFDVYKESAKAILKRLRNEDLGAFITSNKSI